MAWPVEPRATMRTIDAKIVVLGCLFISGPTNCAEKLQLILLIIFLNGECRFDLGRGVDYGKRQGAAPTV
jgi:hypothetical protein